MRKPDYKIEGEYFDCYAPGVTTKTAERVRKGIFKKVVEDKQADRIVLNLDDSPVTPSEMKDILATKPVPGLQEVIVIKGGNIQHIVP